MRGLVLPLNPYGKVQKMQQVWANLTLDEGRFRADFEALSQIGKIGETGVNRPALSPAHLAAREWFRQKIDQAGLKFQLDGAGNHSAYLECGPPGAPTLLVGSHLDSVPNGGRFDGALGVLAGLEALRVIKQNGISLPVNLEAILGSYAFAGLLKSENLTNPRGDPEVLNEGLKRAGLSHESILSARREDGRLAGYLELHVEQGSRLYETGKQIGVVTHIAGISFYRVTFHGRADHAGTIPMEKRRDAALGASAFTLSLPELIIERFPECFANVGDVSYQPGAFNIVPERAVLSLEFRSAEMKQFRDLEAAILRQARLDAEQFGLGIDVESLGNRDPVEMHPRAQRAVQEAAKKFNLRSMPLVSRAGHDAQPMASLCPTGMVFVPSINGISHSPKEFTSWEDCVNGANVLLQAVLQMATYPNR